jgi:probable F420-dependent oxidoreductase
MSTGIPLTFFCVPCRISTHRRRCALKFGIHFFTLNPTLWIPAAREAERVGFESIWIGEHLLVPSVASGNPIHGTSHPPVPTNVLLFDPFVYIAAIAAQTERIRLATGVYNIGLRHPLVTARALVTADFISRGRIEFGVGSSWLKEEWDAMGLDFSTRGHRVDEALEVCLRLWNEPLVKHQGEFFSFPETAFEPKPMQHPMPIVIGGDGLAAMRRAATIGTGWYPLNHPLDRLPRAIERLTELRREAGRDDRLEVTVSGEVNDAADIARYAAAGVDRVIVTPWKSSKDALGALGRFASRFIQ